MDGEKYWLKKVSVILAYPEYAECFADLPERLAQHGIAVSPPEPYTEAGHGVLDTAAEAQGTLWITDSGKTAEIFLGKGCPVLVYLHEGNREEKFGCARYAFESPDTLTAGYLERVYRRYRRIPWDILETERCRIRETTEQDVDAFYEIYKDPEITAYTETLYDSPEEERAYIREYIEKIYGFYEFGVWTIVERGKGIVIGRAGLSVREGFEEPELGFVIGKKWQKKGYAFEVCRAILKFAKEDLGMERIQALVETGNTASVGLCKKLGFYEEDRLTMDGKRYLRMVWNGI